jgi:hypothetical protein
MQIEEYPWSFEMVCGVYYMSRLGLAPLPLPREHGSPTNFSGRGGPDLVSKSEIRDVESFITTFYCLFFVGKAEWFSNVRIALAYSVTKKSQVVGLLIPSCETLQNRL